ncbi:MAG: hypothetical protein ACFFDR_12220 [Candidatus Thorarchaeota archaeon]
MIEIKQIGEPKVLDDNSNEANSYTFHASMSTMRARFSNSYEGYHGNPVWDLTVYADRLIERNIEPLWEGLEEHAQCFQLPMNYIPFGHDGGTFCYNLLESGTHIFDFVEDTRTTSEVRGIWSILCAPESPMILIGGASKATRQKGVYIIDYSGKVVRRIEVLDDTPDAYLSWLMYKPTILSINKKSSAHKTWLSEIDIETDEILQKRAIDPQDILPYDDLSYSQYQEKSGALRTETGYALDGLLRNKWYDYRYNYGRKTLRLKIYHPPIEYLLSADRPETSNVQGILYEYTFKIEFL